jgi:hypothetical protein
MTAVDYEPLTITIPLWEDPPGVFRVGNSRVLLELVLDAFKRGQSPEAIVRLYRSCGWPTCTRSSAATSRTPPRSMNICAVVTTKPKRKRYWARTHPSHWGSSPGD